MSILSRWCFPLLALLAVGGCSGARELALHGSVESDATEARRHYTAGAVAETAGDATSALREYEAALAYDDDAEIHAAAARVSLARRYAPRAVGHAREAVARVPHSRVYRELLASAYLAARDYDSCAAQYAALCRLAPEDLRYRMIVARFLRDRDPAQALAMYRGMLGRWPDDPGVLVAAASCLVDLDRAAEALPLLERAHALDPDDEETLERLADAYFTTRTPAEAAAVFDALCARHPGTGAYELGAARAFAADGDPARAAAHLVRALRTAAYDADDAVRVCDLLCARGIPDAAVRASALAAFDSLAARHPYDWRPPWCAGALLCRSGDVAASCAYFDRVVSLNPRNIEACDALARAFLTAGRFGEAIKPLQILIDRRRATAETYAFLGIAYRSLGMDSLAISSFQHALRLDPRRIDALNALARTFDGRREFPRADTLYERALRPYLRGDLRKDTTYYLLLSCYAYALAERGERLERALDLARAALTAAPENSAFLDTYGWVSFKHGDLAAAREFTLRADEVLRRAGGTPSTLVLDHLGEIMRKLGDRDAARRSWEEALRRDPENDAIRQKLRLLFP